MDVRERLQSSTELTGHGDTERGRQLYARGRRRRSRRLAAGAGGTVAALLLAVVVLPGSGLFGEDGPGTPVVDDLAASPATPEEPEPDIAEPEPEPGPTVRDPWVDRALAGELPAPPADTEEEPAAPVEEQPAAPVEEEPTAEPAPSGPVAVGDDASTADRERAPAGEADLVLTDVRVGVHPGFDRVTLEFAGTGQAGWFTGLDDRAVEHGKGREFDVAGSSVLTVFANMLIFPPDAPEGVARWEEERLAAPAGAGVLTEVVNAEWYEGQQQLFLGLREPVAYRIGRLTGPERIVIDLLHP